MQRESLSTESRETPKTVLDYLGDKHSTIINDYKTPEGEHSEHCGLIALDIAELLLASGRQPYITKIMSRSKPLAPTTYKGRVTWGGHQVCCCDGEAFEPILGKPVAIEDYTKSVFGEDIKMEVSIPYEKIEEYISRGKVSETSQTSKQ